MDNPLALETVVDNLRVSVTVVGNLLAWEIVADNRLDNQAYLVVASQRHQISDRPETEPTMVASVELAVRR